MVLSKIRKISPSFGAKIRSRGGRNGELRVLSGKDRKISPVIVGRVSIHHTRLPRDNRQLGY